MCLRIIKFQFPHLVAYLSILPPPTQHSSASQSHIKRNNCFPVLFFPLRCFAMLNKNSIMSWNLGPRVTAGGMGGNSFITSRHFPHFALFYYLGENTKKPFERDALPWDFSLSKLNPFLRLSRRVSDCKNSSSPSFLQMTKANDNDREIR